MNALDLTATKHSPVFSTLFLLTSLADSDGSLHNLIFFLNSQPKDFLNLKKKKKKSACFEGNQQVSDTTTHAIIVLQPTHLLWKH